MRCRRIAELQECEVRRRRIGELKRSPSPPARSRPTSRPSSYPWTVRLRPDAQSAVRYLPRGRRGPPDPRRGRGRRERDRDGRPPVELRAVTEERVEVVYMSGAGAGSRRGPSGMEFAREEESARRCSPTGCQATTCTGRRRSQPPARSDGDAVAARPRLVGVGALEPRPKLLLPVGLGHRDPRRRLAALPRLGHQARRASRRVRLPAALVTDRLRYCA